MTPALKKKWQRGIVIIEAARTLYACRRCGDERGEGMALVALLKAVRAYEKAYGEVTLFVEEDDHDDVQDVPDRGSVREPAGAR